MILRLRYVKQGGYYHCRVFTLKDGNQEFGAKSGHLVFTEEEWPQVEAFFNRKSNVGNLTVEILPEVER